MASPISPATPESRETPAPSGYRDDPVVIRTKLLAHAFTLKGNADLSEPGTPTRSVRLEGFDPRLVPYASLLEALGEKGTGITPEEVDLLQSAFQFSQDPDAHHIANMVERGHPVVIQSGFEGHSFSFIIYGNYFCMCDRANGEKTYTLYHINRRKVTPELVQQLIDLSNKDESLVYNFTDNELPALLDAHTNDFCDIVTENISIPPQKAGNCVYVNTLKLPTFLLLLIHRLKIAPADDPTVILSQAPNLRRSISTAFRKTLLNWEQDHSDELPIIRICHVLFYLRTHRRLSPENANRIALWAVEHSSEKILVKLFTKHPESLRDLPKATLKRIVLEAKEQNWNELLPIVIDSIFERAPDSLFIEEVCPATHTSEPTNYILIDTALFYNDVDFAKKCFAERPLSDKDRSLILRHIAIHYPDVLPSFIATETVTPVHGAAALYFLQQSEAFSAIDSLRAAFASAAKPLDATAVQYVQQKARDTLREDLADYSHALLADFISVSASKNSKMARTQVEEEETLLSAHIAAVTEAQTEVTYLKGSLFSWFYRLFGTLNKAENSLATAQAALNQARGKLRLARAEEIIKPRGSPEVSTRS